MMKVRYMYTILVFSKYLQDFDVHKKVPLEMFPMNSQRFQ